MATNLGKWNRWYGLLDPATPEPYGDSPSYGIVADFSAGLATADWGCGKGWLRNFIPAHLYTGIDGSASPFADVIADLATYTAPSPAIILRHVLEHDYRWRDILRNAAAAALERLAIVLFTPTTGHTTEQIAWNDEPGVPDLAFALPELLALLEPAFSVEVRELASPRTQYKVETILLARRNQ